MGETMPGQVQLFKADLAGFVAQISWRPGEGWRLHVNSWQEGQLPGSGHQDEYARLTFEELLDVLEVVCWERCDWLRPRPGDGTG